MTRTDRLIPTKLANPPKIRGLSYTQTSFVVSLDDGRALSVPLDWYPALRDASASVREHWKPVHDGMLVEWPSLKLTLLIEGLLISRGPLTDWESEGSAAT
jgi:Protein of unknown function (DUF2442)